jgi:hypothetical protein
MPILMEKITVPTPMGCSKLHVTEENIGLEQCKHLKMLGIIIMLIVHVFSVQKYVKVKGLKLAFFFFFFLYGSHCVAKASLKLVGSSHLP